MNSKKNNIKEEIRLSKEKERQSQLSKLMKFTALIAIISTIPDFYYQVWEGVAVLGLDLTLLSVLYFYNLKGHVNKVGHLFVFLFSVIIFFSSSQFGFDSFSFLFYLPLVVVTPFIVDSKNKYFYYFHLIHPVIFIGILFATDFSWFATGNPYTIEQSKIIAEVNVMATLLLSYHIVNLRMQSAKNGELKYEQALLALNIQNVQLQKTNKELDRFVYSVSHDLRAPIASSLGLVELSKGEDDIEKLRHYNLLKEKTLRRLDDYVNSLLNFSRNYRTEVGKDEIDFNLLFEECIAFNKPYGNNESQLVVKIDVNQTGVFLGDNLRMRIIVNNLISNALKYHNPQEHEQLIALAVSSNDKIAIIKVRDNGIGIATGKLDNVFDMFYRASETTKGSGLGLYITKEIIEKLGGSITVDSILGSGTTFTITLPNFKQDLTLG